jgi:signal peptidase I
MQNVTVQTDEPSWARRVIIGRNPRRTFIRILVLVVVSVVVFKWVLLPIRLDGPSMLPTYRSGSVNFVNRLAYWNSEPQRGDVVAVRYSGHSIMLMKRVVGLPGETIEFVKGRLWVNGRPLDEPYVKFSCDWNVRPEHYLLRDDEYYVVGDNRSMPFENHQQGAARRQRILGRIML